MRNKKLVTTIIITILAIVSVCITIGTISGVINVLPNLFDGIGNTLMFLIGAVILLFIVVKELVKLIGG